MEKEIKAEKHSTDSTDNCYLTLSDEEEGGGYLVCTYNHKIGEKCLMDDKNDNLSSNLVE